MAVIDSQAKVHVFICTNDRSHLPEPRKPSCSAKIREEDFREVKAWIKEEGLVGKVYCTRTHCLGFCNAEGGVLVVYPQGKFHIGVQNTEEIKVIIRSYLTDL